MLREVVAEPPLHAGRADVGRVLLDPRAGDPHHLLVGDVEVHLAPHAAVGADGTDHPVGLRDLEAGEPLGRQHLVDGPGGADPDALAAPGAGRVIGVAVAAHHDLGGRAPLRHVQHAHHLDVRAGGEEQTQPLPHAGVLIHDHHPNGS